MTNQARALSPIAAKEPASPEAVPFRAAPHNIEAEQALLGAMLVNNEAHDRVSGFLLPEHFFDPLHAQIYETTAKLIGAGKQATAITLRTYFERHEPIDQNLTVPQYLGRLTANATTIINARDYGQTVYDLAIRRQLITIGEDMVNTAYDSPIDIPPAAQIEESEGRLFALAENGKYGQGFLGFSTALDTAIRMANAAYERDGGLSGISCGLRDLDGKMGGLQSSDLIILAGRPSMGKAQPLDAKVLTRSGWTRMGDLAVGDQLASIDGRPSEVAGIFSQGQKQIFRVTFSDGRSAECCDEHLWRVHYREWDQPRIVSTRELASLLTHARYRGRIWIDTFEGDFGDPVDLPLDPWLLGALIGDGTLLGSSVRFSTADADQIERVRERAGARFDLKPIGGYDYRIVTHGGQFRTGLQGVVPNAIMEALRALELWDVRSEGKFIPRLYLSAPRADRLDLLRGLLDTDGWVERWGSVRFATSSPRLANDVAELVRSLGGQCTIKSKQAHYTYRYEKRTGRASYVLNIQHSDPHQLFLLPNKRARLADRRRQKRLTVTSIVPTRMAEAQCIAVTHPDNLYVTDDFVVTHNTALVTNIAFNVAKARLASLAQHPDKDPTDKTHDGAIVGFFSLEMSAEQLATRILSEQAAIGSEKIRRGMISEAEFKSLVRVSNEMAEIPLYIDQTGGISIAQLAARARKLKRQKGLGLLIVDYLQLLSGSSKRAAEGRVQEITEITTGLKALAKELECPVIALSQLSRQVENREDKRPQLSDLRESGSIEQDADVVMFVFREEYYVERTKPAEGTAEFQEWMTKMQMVSGKAEVIIGKQRHGPVGTVQLAFDGHITRFSDLAKEQYLPERRE